MGVVVEYAGRTGLPRWIKPSATKCDYTMFGGNLAVTNPDETIQLVFGKVNGGKGGFNQWTMMVRAL